MCGYYKARKNIYLLVISVFVTLLLIFSCPTSYDDSDDSGSSNNGSSTEVKTIFWEPDDEDNTQFYTNDSKYLGPEGWTFWHWTDYSEDEMDYVETVVFKVSGNPAYPYGVIFCVDEAGENYLTVMIDAEGWYIIGKVVNYNFETIQDWTYPTDPTDDILMEGYNTPNKIRVNYMGDNKFHLIFNDFTDKLIEFEDKNEPFLTGGRYGFIATIAPDEAFPDTSVDVRFNQIWPEESKSMSSVKKITDKVSDKQYFKDCVMPFIDR